LAAADRKPDAPLLKRAVEAELKGIYQAAFQAMALQRIDPKGNSGRLEKIARFLVEQQTKSGSWSYGKLVAATDAGDNSNTAYALLGLRACAESGVGVPEKAWEEAAAWWRKAQNDDGGWGYRTDREIESYLSMTESGVSSLALCDARLGKAAGGDVALRKGMEWLDAHFTAEQNAGSAYQAGRQIYHLYAAARTAAMAGAAKLNGRDPWKDAAAFLLGTQREDGSWDDGAETPVPNTALALLVLTRATRELK
jgi:squalene cyclase